VRVHHNSTGGAAGIPGARAGTSAPSMLTGSGPIQRMFNGEEESKEESPAARRRGVFSALPSELATHIMTFLPQQDIASLAATNHHTNQDVESAITTARQVRMGQRGRHRRRHIVKRRTEAWVGSGLANLAHHRHFQDQRRRGGGGRGRRLLGLLGGGG
jgi:hypothetical protein